VKAQEKSEGIWQEVKAQEKSGEIWPGSESTGTPLPHVMRLTLCNVSIPFFSFTLNTFFQTGITSLQPPAASQTKQKVL
jgi:hypothetical protein